MRVFGASLGVLVAAVACGAATGSSVHTGLYGKVTKGPLTPACSDAEPCDGPAADLPLVFSRNGTVVARTRTGADGRYRVALRPGRYAVRAGPNRFNTATPTSASVPQTGFRHVNFFVDTGIR